MGQTSMFVQARRFAVTGGIATALGAATYWLAATRGNISPLLANFLAYLVALASGYVLHSRWSFAGHGSRDNPLGTTGRFLIVSLVSLGLNSFFVWFLLTVLEGPKWWPVITMIFVTPLATFSLNRQWVFR